MFPSLVTTIIFLLNILDFSVEKFEGCDSKIKTLPKNNNYNNHEHYTAGVIEYEPIELSDDVTNPEKYMISNVNRIKQLIVPKKDLDILVFPEYALTSTKVLDRNDFDEFAQEIPDEQIYHHSACQGNQKYWSVLEHLSCIAFSFETYLVVNLITKHYKNGSKTSYFNSAIAFDRQGKIIAHYHKYNLYGSEKIKLTKPDYPMAVKFETDFGIRVGLLICFDINFLEPVNQLDDVDVIAYPVAWTDELPFLTAPQYHMGFAIAKNITLLASGYHNSSIGSQGSGIYHGESKILNITYTNRKTATFITSEIQKSPEIHTIPKAFEFEYHKNDFYLFENMTNYKKIEVINGIHEIIVEDLELMCHFKYEYIGTPGLMNLIVYSGVRTFGGGSTIANIQICGLSPKCLKCPLQNSMFKYLEINGTFTSEDNFEHLTIPVGLKSNLSPLTEFSWVDTKKSKKMTLKDNMDLFSAALYTRIF